MIHRTFFVTVLSGGPESSAACRNLSEHKYLGALLSRFLLIILLSSCSTIETLPFETEEEIGTSALIILGNPPGTFPVTITDIPELLEFTKNKNPAVRHMAIYQLAQLDSTSFYKDILPLLLDDDISVSRNTEELILRNEKQALDVFRAALNSDNTELKLKALDLLVKLNDRESLSHIIELFADIDENVVDKAIYSASKLADVNDKILFDTLLRTETALRVGVVKTLNKMGDSTVLGTLLPYFYDPDVKVQNAVKFAFVDFGDESIPYLLNVLNNPEPQTQMSILGLLEALKNRDSIPAIINLFNNENERVKAGAINTVSTFKEEAVDFLGESLSNENEEIVINSVSLLGKIQNDDALNYLIPNLNHENVNIRVAVFDAILLFTETAGNKLLRIIDRREKSLYESAVKGLIILRDSRLVVDNNTSLYNRNNRGQVFILHSSRSELISYLDEIDVSGLITRDYKFLKEMSIAASLLIKSEKDISDSGSKYTTFYISKNEFIKKSEEALQLSFSYMHNYMNSKNPEDLEIAKTQQNFSNLFKDAAVELEEQLVKYIGSTEEEILLIETFENSRKNLISLYESVSLNRKNLADNILSIYGLNYADVLSGNLNVF